MRAVGRGRPAQTVQAAFLHRRTCGGGGTLPADVDQPAAAAAAGTALTTGGAGRGDKNATGPLPRRRDRRAVRHPAAAKDGLLSRSVVSGQWSVVSGHYIKTERSTKVIKAERSAMTNEERWCSRPDRSNHSD